MVKSSQMIRLLEFDWMVRNNRYPNTASFAQRYGVSSKTIQRDIAFLRDFLEAPIVFDPSHKGFIYQGRWTPPLLMLAVAINEARLWLADTSANPPAGGLWEDLAGKIQASYRESKKDDFIPYEQRFTKAFQRIVA